MKDQQKIGVVLSVFPKLSETFVAQEIQLLEERGVSLEIVAITKSDETRIQPIAAGIKTRVVHAPTSRGAIPMLLRGNMRALAAQPRAYVATLITALRNQVRFRTQRPLACFTVAGWLVQRWQLGRGEIAHLHSHFLDRAGLVASYAARIGGIGHSMSAHARDVYTMPRPLIVEMVQRATVLMTCTRFNARHLSGPGIDEKKLHVVYHGIDSRRFSPGQPHGTRIGDPARLISIGRLVPKKGYRDLILSVSRLHDTGVALRYDIYGDGPLRDELRDLCAARGLHDQVTFHGMVLQDQLVEALREGGILLCGSRTCPDGDRDGIPNSLAEAMSMQIPVVATRTSGIPELIEDRVTGILVPPEDPEAMASAALRLIREPELAEEIGRAARQWIVNHFDSRSCFRRWEEVMAEHAGGLSGEGR